MNDRHHFRQGIPEMLVEKIQARLMTNHLLYLHMKANLSKILASIVCLIGMIIFDLSLRQ